MQILVIVKNSVYVWISFIQDNYTITNDYIEITQIMIVMADTMSRV